MNIMEKIPCMVCYNPESWNYIRRELESIGYKPSNVCLSGKYDVLEYPLVVLNHFGRLGEYGNDGMGAKDLYNREIIHSRKEFFDKAKKLFEDLKGNLNLSEFSLSDLSSGMVVEHRNGIQRLIIKIKDSLFLMNSNSCSSLRNYNLDLTCNYSYDYDIVRVFEIEDIDHIDHIDDFDSIFNRNSIDNSKLSLIWIRESSIKGKNKFTKKEISDILGVSLDELEIVD